MLSVGQDIFVLEFEPPPELERLIGDAACPRTGPAVLLYADSIDLGLWEAEPLEPQRALWTEVAIGYHCEARGAPATAFHFPYLMLSAPHGDPGQALADVAMTRFHAGCPEYDGPAAGRRCAATARSYAGVPIVDLELELREPGTLPAGLMRWVNRLKYPDVNAPGADLDAGLFLVAAEQVRLADVWRGTGSATFHVGMGWSGTVAGEAWVYGTTYVIDTVEAL